MLRWALCLNDYIIVVIFNLETLFILTVPPLPLPHPRLGVQWWGWAVESVAIIYSHRLNDGSFTYANIQDNWKTLMQRSRSSNGHLWQIKQRALLANGVHSTHTSKESKKRMILDKESHSSWAWANETGPWKLSTVWDCEREVSHWPMLSQISHLGQ